MYVNSPPGGGLSASSSSISSSSSSSGAVDTGGLSSAMDVDSSSPSTTTTTAAVTGTLKRCSSAPMINENPAIMTTSPQPNNTTREPPIFNLFGPNAQPRTRRFSASSGPPTVDARLTQRINQLRHEECVDITNQREVAHERETHHTMQISQSWEDLSLLTTTISSPPPTPSSSSLSPKHQPHNSTTNNNNNCSSSNSSSKMAPLHIQAPPYGANNTTTGGFLTSGYQGNNSPSPTRLLTSPGGYQSPTRSNRPQRVPRSASPVLLRPSPLSVKRKLDEDKMDCHLSPRQKRFNSISNYGTPPYHPNNYTNHLLHHVDRGGLLTTTNSNNPPIITTQRPLSACSGSLVSASGSLCLGSAGGSSTAGTPDSMSSADSPGCGSTMGGLLSTRAVVTSSQQQQQQDYVMMGGGGGGGDGVGEDGKGDHHMGDRHS